MAEERGSTPLLPALVLLVIVLYAFYRVHQALTPFILAAAFAYVVNPAVTYFEARGLRRSQLVVGGYLAALALGFAAYEGIKPLVVEQAERIAAEAPRYYQDLRKLAAAQQAKLTQQLPLPRPVAQKALESAVGGTLERIQDLPSQLFALVPFLAHAVLIPFIGFFLILDGASAVDGLIQVTPSRHVEQTIHLLGEIDTALGNYLRGILIVAAAITMASFAGLYLMGIDNALLISVIAGLSSFVPYLGAIAGALIGGAMAFYQFGTLWAAFKVVLLFAGIRAADEILLQPVIARHSVHLHPMVFLLALILGGELFGFLGLVFAIPVACIVKALVRVGWSWYASEAGLALAADGTSVPYT